MNVIKLNDKVVIIEGPNKGTVGTVTDIWFYNDKHKFCVVKTLRGETLDVKSNYLKLYGTSVSSIVSESVLTI